jgi:hypothetical protein
MATIGLLATLGSRVDVLNLLECAGFDLSKKVFLREGAEGSRTYMQADTDAEAKVFKRSGMDSFFLARAKASLPVEGDHARAFR